jgi:hypothetical protein
MCAVLPVLLIEVVLNLVQMYFSHSGKLSVVDWTYGAASYSIFPLWAGIRVARAGGMRRWAALGGVCTLLGTVLSGALATLFVTAPTVAQWGAILLGLLVLSPVLALFGFLGGAFARVRIKRGTLPDDPPDRQARSVNLARDGAAAGDARPPTRSFAARSWRVAKYTATIGVLLFAILFVIGWYVTNSRADAARNSLFIQSLDRAERENGDALKLLFDGLAAVNEAEAKQVLTWLSARQYRGELPYLYLIGLYNGKSNDNARQQQGIEFLAIAMLVYRIDAAKCGDPTALQAIPILEGAMGIKAIRDTIKTKPELRRLIVDKALEYEAKSKNRQRPEWVCAHGIRSGTPPSEESMESHRQEMRAQFKTSF